MAPESSNIQLPPVDDPGFEAQKRQYFINLGLRVLPALRAHKAVGLLERNEDGEKSWRNVTEHCVVETARAEVFSDLLGLSSDLKADLMMAATLHDFYKKKEQELIRTHGLHWESFEKATEESTDILKASGFSERVVWLANAVGHDSLEATEQILQKDELSADEVAFLILHYIDDYSIGSDWAESTEVVDGLVLNTLDRRIDYNIGKPQNSQLNEDGREIFGGRTTFEVQREVGHGVEARLTSLVNGQQNQHITEKDLPVYVDSLLAARISAITL